MVVPPGEYQARLKVGDVTLTQPFNVLIDPRVAEDGVTIADLQEQFAHNMRVREKTRLLPEFGKLRPNCATPRQPMARD